MEKPIEQLKKVELEILKEFDRICKKHNLYYTIAYGTMIGAVRHHGFIPWDDDIDVHMTYEDYKKLEAIANEELGDGFYFQSRKNNVQNYIYWNRVGKKNTTSIDQSLAHIHADWGICIDIFPLLPLGNNEQEIAEGFKVYDKINKYCLKYLMINTKDGCGFVEKIKKSIHGLIPDSLSVSLTNKFLDQLGNKGLDNVKYCTSGTDRHVMETKWFKEREYMQFEDMEVPVMKEWDAYLTKIYGDYMKLPKEEDRVCHVNENHIIKFDEPYQNYYR